MNASVRLLQLVLPSTVLLKTEVPAEHPSAQILGTERLGTGVLMDSGLVLTVNYVVLGARKVEISFLDDAWIPARVVAQDFASGIAAVEADGQGRPWLKLRSSADLKVGDEIFIVAAASENKRRANDGAITSLGSFDAYWEYSLDRAILTTAMNPGLGGAPLFDVLGRIVGIVSLELTEVGRFTLAIPTENFVDHREELLRNGRRVTRPPRAWVGFYCYTFRDHVVIAGVLPGTPGDHAGLKAGDVVVAVDGRTINGRHDLFTRLWVHRPGDVIHLSVYRDNEVKHVAVAGGDAEAFFK